MTLRCRRTGIVRRVRFDLVAGVSRWRQRSTWGFDEFRLGLPGFPVGPEPFRLLLMSDFHFSPSMPVEYIRCCVDRALALRPDLIPITGDFAACEGWMWGDSCRSLRGCGHPWVCMG